MPEREAQLIRRAAILAAIFTLGLILFGARPASGDGGGGQPGIRVIVEMATGPARGRAAIARARAGLLARMEGAAPGSYRVTRALTTIPFVAMELSGDGLDALKRAPGVVRVSIDRLLRPDLDASVSLIGGDRARAAGYTGAGWAVAVIDTGVDRSHPFLSGRVVAEACYSAEGDCPDGRTARSGTGSAPPCTWAPVCAHGTHVAGIAAGSGTIFSGVAPEAQVISVRVFSRFTGAACAGSGSDPCAMAWTSDVAAGLERVFTLRASFAIAAVNLSLGGGLYADQATCDAEQAALKAIADRLRAEGIAVVAASGNDGYDDAINAPACLSGVVSVGAATKTDAVAWFSNAAPFLSLLAPGESIVSSVPGRGSSSWSGTSMAAPHVTGAWALAKQAAPGSGVDVVAEALESTGAPIADPRNGRIEPRINVDRILFTCAAGADPAGGPAPLETALEGSASQGTGPYIYEWDFGDGSTIQAGQRATHVYRTPGDYTVTLTARDAAGLACVARSAVSAGGPRIARVRRARDPFRLIVEGSGFSPGDIVRIDGAAAPGTSFRSPTRLVALKGAPLRAMIPAGLPVAITVTTSAGVVSASVLLTR